MFLDVSNPVTDQNVRYKNDRFSNILLQWGFEDLLQRCSELFEKESF